MKVLYLNTTGGLKPDQAVIGYAIGSVEGRVSIEYFDKSPAVQKEKYAFKCHRQTIPEGDLVFPVNALAFHPAYVNSLLWFNAHHVTHRTVLPFAHYRYGTLATGGSDGTVAVWDHRAKKRVKLYNRMPTAISALAFSADGSRLAVAASNAQDSSSGDSRSKLAAQGDDPNHISIVVRPVGDEFKVRLQLEMILLLSGIPHASIP